MAASGPVLFEADIVPFRSLGRTGRRVLGGALGCLALPGFGIAWLLHAWPVMLFLPVALGLAFLLLRQNSRAASQTEHLRLTEQELRIQRPGRRDIVLPTAWLRAELAERPGRTPALTLRGIRRQVEIATCLGEAEKRSLAEALAAALARLRQPAQGEQQF